MVVIVTKHMQSFVSPEQQAVSQLTAGRPQRECYRMHMCTQWTGFFHSFLATAFLVEGMQEQITYNFCLQLVTSCEYVVTCLPPVQVVNVDTAKPIAAECKLCF